MTIDKDKLRALAEAAGSGEWACAIHEDCECVEGSEGFVASFDTLDVGRFIAAANPSTILAMLGEIERLEPIGQLARNQDGYRALLDERDQLKAENAELRKDAERLDWIDDNYTGHGGGTEFNLRLHLPCDIEDGGLRHAIDAAMAKEKGHDC